MKIKKIAATVAAAAVLASTPIMGALPDAMSMTASAAEEKLITAPFPDGIKDMIFYSLGNGYYFTVIADEDWNRSNKVIRAGDQEIEQWRKTGTFSYTDVESEVDLSNMDSYTFRIQDGCMYFKSGDNFYVMKVDESANKLVKVQEFSDGRTWSRVDGYYVSVTGDDTTAVYTVYDANGKKIENKLTYTSSGKGDLDSPLCFFYGCNSDKYLGYMIWMLPGTIIPGSEEEPWKATAKFDIYGIKKDGSRDVIASAVNGPASNSPSAPAFIISYSNDYFAWMTDDCINIYTVNDGKTHKLSALELKYGPNGAYSVNSIIGSKAVLFSKKSFSYAYGIAQLVDISGEGEVLLEGNKIEAIDNGNMYYFCNQDYKYGFLDSTGKVIGEWYDQANNFKNDNLYTSVQKDDKWWLIDRNMNQVSEKFDDRVEVIGDDFFKSSVTDENSHVTYVFSTFANKVESSRPTNPTTPEKPVAKPVDYSDDTTGIKATANEGVIADGAKLTVSAVADKTDDNSFTYEISFKKDGKDVQPDGIVTVKIPVPEAIKDKKIYVYRVEGDKYYDMGAKTEDGCVVFKTSHFSEYLVTINAVEGAVNDNPDTGIPGISFAMAAIAAAGLIVVGKKRK